MKNTNKRTPKSPLFDKNERQYNNIEIVDKTKQRNFVIVYDTIYKNQDLNGYELALLIYLITRAPNYKPNKNGLINALGFSRAKYESAIDGLKKKGYLSIERKGKNDYRYTINQEPTLWAKDNTINFESLAPLRNKQYYYELYKIGLIDKELLDQLIDHYYSVKDINLWK